MLNQSIRKSTTLPCPAWPLGLAGLGFAKSTTRHESTGMITSTGFIELVSCRQHRLDTRCCGCAKSVCDPNTSYTPRWGPPADIQQMAPINCCTAGERYGMSTIYIINASNHRSNPPPGLHATCKKANAMHNAKEDSPGRQQARSRRPGKEGKEACTKY